MFISKFLEMKKIQVILVMMIFLFSGTMAQSPVKSKSLKPTNFQKRVTTVISGKSRNYYSLSAVNPSVITVQGPGKIMVNTRGRFEPAQASKIGYEILYSIDGGVQKNVLLSGIDRSKEATYVNGALGVPGELKNFEIDLGRGNHTIEFKLKDSKINVAARYIFKPTKEKKQEWISFSPLTPSEAVELISGESTTNYYRFSAAKPLKVTIIGPSELRILTRAENHVGMKGRIHYRIQVKESNNVISTYLLSSDRSETAFYKENKSLIPGKACEVDIIVPTGSHTYTIIPLDEDKNTVLGRLLIPKKDVKLK